MNRRGFLGALAATIAAPRLLAKLAPAPTCWRCGKTGEPGWSVPGDTAKRWWKCESCIGRDLRYEDMPIGVGEIGVGERLSFIRSRKLPPDTRMYGDPALLRRLFLRPSTGFAAWERRVLG
jgi:hypothetical protein